MDQLPPPGPAAQELTSLVAEHTLELADPGLAPIVGTTQVDPGRSGGEHDLSGLPTASIECILSQRLRWPMQDPVGSVQDWRRVLQPGGRLAFVVEGDAPPRPVLDLLDRVGGFVIESVRDLGVTGGKRSWMAVAQRSVVADIRNPLVALSPAIVETVNHDADARSELYFNLGSLLLQTGDPQLAEHSFRALLALEPQSSHARFGIGMALAATERWDEALSELQKAIALTPGDAEIERWIELARERVGGAGSPEAAAQLDSIEGLPTMELVDRLAAVAEELSQSATEATQVGTGQPTS